RDARRPAPPPGARPPPPAPGASKRRAGAWRPSPPATRPGAGTHDRPTAWRSARPATRPLRQGQRRSPRLSPPASWTLRDRQAIRFPQPPGRSSRLGLPSGAVDDRPGDAVEYVVLAGYHLGDAELL